MEGFIQQLALDMEEETRALASQILESLRAVKIHNFGVICAL